MAVAGKALGKHQSRSASWSTFSVFLRGKFELEIRVFQTPEPILDSLPGTPEKISPSSPPAPGRPTDTQGSLLYETVCPRAFVSPRRWPDHRPAGRPKGAVERSDDCGKVMIRGVATVLGRARLYEEEVGVGDERS
ncbi:unnamed protein product [Soboliphyme baturini]|uniref:Uncharacterized protein n=1 Tax=Soboliphyme baturini TaxID=241478 RepID=A0A183IPJ6_9BILA|nr:unnamed protein product [Soboliphyme baturini]